MTSHYPQAPLINFLSTKENLDWKQDGENVVIICLHTIPIK